MAGKSSKSAAGKGGAKKTKSGKPAAKAKAPAKKSPVKAAAKKAPAKKAPAKAAAKKAPAKKVAAKKMSAKKAPAKAAPKKAAVRKPVAKSKTASKAKASAPKKSPAKIQGKKSAVKPAARLKAKSSKRVPGKSSSVKKAIVKKVVAPIKRSAGSITKTVKKAVGKTVKLAKKTTGKTVTAAKKEVKKVVRVAKKETKAAVRFGKKETKVAVGAVKETVKSKLTPGKKQSGPKAASIARTASAASGRDSRKTDERAGQKMPLKQSTIDKYKAPAAPVRVRVPDAPPVAEAAPPEKKVKLKADDLKKLRNSLLQERSRIMEEIRTLDEQALTERVEEGANQQPGFSLQLADSASENVSVETALILRSTEDEELSKIEDALRAIETGDYGMCHRCREAISMERLLVKPMARYCVPCLRLLESGKA